MSIKLLNYFFFKFFSDFNVCSGVGNGIESKNMVGLSYREGLRGFVPLGKS